MYSSTRSQSYFKIICKTLKILKMSNPVRSHYQFTHLFIYKCQMTHTHTQTYSKRYMKYYPIRGSTDCEWWFCSWGSGRTLWPGRSLSSPLFWAASPPPAWQSSDSELFPWCQTSRGRGNGSASGTSLCRSRTRLAGGREGTGCDWRGDDKQRVRYGTE